METSAKACSGGLRPPGARKTEASTAVTDRRYNQKATLLRSQMELTTGAWPGNYRAWHCWSEARRRLIRLGSRGRHGLNTNRAADAPAPTFCRQRANDEIA